VIVIVEWRCLRNDVFSRKQTQGHGMIWYGTQYVVLSTSRWWWYTALA